MSIPETAYRGVSWGAIKTQTFAQMSLIWERLSHAVWLGLVTETTWLGLGVEKLWFELK